MRTQPGFRAAVQCLALAGILLLSALACDLPVTGATQTATPLPATVQPPPANTQPAAQAPTPTAPANLAPPSAPTGTQPGPAVSQVQIYLVAVGDSSSGKPVGCGDSLVPVTRQITPAREPIAAALNELFAIKTQTLGQSGLYNALYQSNLRVESAEVDANHIATVVLTGQVMMGGECDIPRFKGQIEQTILGVGGIQSANILLNGKPIDQALSLK